MIAMVMIPGVYGCAAPVVKKLFSLCSAPTVPPAVASSPINRLGARKIDSVTAPAGEYAVWQLPARPQTDRRTAVFLGVVQCSVHETIFEVFPLTIGRQQHIGTVDDEQAVSQRLLLEVPVASRRRVDLLGRIVIAEVLL